ncbi:MAG: hypothetical protein L6Q35_03980, partial [Phycisphaerales bacterium]|nr:hypothetical protein [Phycisphaerales bacterium]
MFRASVGGRDAAHPLYRHTLVHAISGLLGPAARLCRGWNGMGLALAALLMSWDAAPTLAQRFESVLCVIDTALPRRRRTGRTYQGFVKALSRRGRVLRDLLTAHLRDATRRLAGLAFTINGLVPIGVDGSRFDAPRTIANEGLGVGGR